MDLITLLEQVPPLLSRVCDEDDHDQHAELRRLRLVNKEGARIALQALQSYTLTLKVSLGSHMSRVGS